MWFEELTGFREGRPEQVRRQLAVEGDRLYSRINDRQWRCGTLEIPTLAELRKRARAAEVPSGRLTVRQVVADVRGLHGDPANTGSLFQVASQFNLLEMTGPEVTPEEGVDRYEYDRTQGPACAIAAGAGTIYRNYFVELDGRRGQSAKHQIDCLADLGEALGNSGGRHWRMRNGYALASEAGLRGLTDRLRASSPEELDRLRGLLRIGVQRDTEVTIASTAHTVTQAFCSALPVAYSMHPAELWAPFARLILEAAYEATLLAGVLNARRTGNSAVFLTSLGGGAFGNENSWIVAAMERAFRHYRRAPLRVAVVSHGRPKQDIEAMISRMGNTGEDENGLPAA
jgi:hypothetical protein